MRQCAKFSKFIYFYEFSEPAEKKQILHQSRVINDGKGLLSPAQIGHAKVKLRQNKNNKNNNFQQAEEEEDADTPTDADVEAIRILTGGKLSEARIKKIASSIKEDRKKKEEEEKIHSFPYHGLPDEERAMELQLDRQFYHDVLADKPSEEDRTYVEQRLRETDYELHKLYERGIGGYIAGSEHDPEREAYNQS
jgi:hypothetical protein